MAAENPSIARGERIYAIGDVHGRFDLMTQLMGLIRRDAEIHCAQTTRILFVGDLVDRGPQSREVVDRLRDYTRQTDKMIVLKGNHEQIMVQALRGDLDALEAWLKFGGDKTLISWGVADTIFSQPLEAIFHAAREAVPPDVLVWMDRLPLTYLSGDFFFVHAGIRPGIDLTKQSPADLMWITSDFLDHEEEHPAVIVHGHTIVEHGPQILRHRIALDTGAYKTGRLSAVAFEGSRQWMVTT